MKIRVACVGVVLLSLGWSPFATAQYKEPLLTRGGVEAPCLGIGLGVALVSKCVKLSEEQGAIRVSEVGYSGLTLGTAGPDDGKVTEVAAGSPAEAAGVRVGDAVVAVNGKAAALTPGAIAHSHLFGEKGQPVTVKTRRAGAESEAKLVRAPAPAPPNVPKGNIFLIIKPLMDWHGEYVPCMGAGPLASAAFAFCDRIFKPHGFVRTADLGTTGIVMDMERKDAAVIHAVDPESPAAQGGIRAGDEVLTVDGKPLEASLGENAKREMFAKVGASVTLTVRRAGAEQTVQMTLAAKPKS